MGRDEHRSSEVISQLQDSSFSDITDQFMSSDLDDVIVFSSNRQYIFDEGPTKGRIEGPQIYETGRWDVIANKQLVLQNEHSSTTYDVIHLSTDQLVLRLSVEVEKQHYSYILTFQPKE